MEKERIKQILVVVATISVIFINYLAGTGQINNTTPGDISDKFSTAITPAGYAFSIWSVIYLGLVAFSIYQMLSTQKDNSLFSKIRLLYIVNCAANCVWIFLWHYLFIGTSILAMLTILLTLIFINREVRNALTNAEIWTTKVPFNLYFGWITAATILNATISLIALGVKFPDLLITISSVALLAVATFLAVLIRRNFNFPAYAIAIAWALIAIAVRNSDNTIIMTTAITTGLIALTSAFIFGKRAIA